MDPSKLASIFSNEHEMRKLIEAIHNIEDSIGRVADKIAGASEASTRAVKSAEEGLESVKSQLSDSVDSLDELAKQSEEMFTSWEKHVMGFKNLISPLTDELDRIKDKLSKLSMRDVVEGLGHTMGGLASNPGNAIEGLLGKVPYIGPFLELALESQFRQERYQAGGRQTAMQFARTGQVTPEQVHAVGNALGDETRKLEENFLATKDDINSVWSAFASGGVRMESMLQPAGVAIKGFGDTIPQVALGIDKAFQMASGSAASFSSQLTRDTGNSLQKTVKQVRDLGLAAHESAMDSQAFIGTIVQLTSALRTQGGDAEGLVLTYRKVASAYREMLPGQGTAENRLNAGERAMDIVKNIPQTLQGFDAGLKALVGQRMAELRTGKVVSGEQGLREFETGLTLEGKPLKDFVTQALRISSEIMTRNTTGETDKYLALSRGATHFSPQLADILARGGGSVLDKFVNSAEEFKDTVAKMQLEKLSGLDKLMEDIKQVMMSFGQLTVSILGSIYTAIVGGFKAISPKSGYSFESYEEDLKASTGKIADRVVDVGKYLDKAGGQFTSELGEAFGPLLSDEQRNLKKNTPAPAPTVHPGAPFKQSKFATAGSVGKATTTHTIVDGDDTIHVNLTADVQRQRRTSYGVPPIHGPELSIK